MKPIINIWIEQNYPTLSVKVADIDALHDAYLKLATTRQTISKQQIPLLFKKYYQHYSAANKHHTFVQITPNENFWLYIQEHQIQQGDKTATPSLADLTPKQLKLIKQEIANNCTSYEYTIFCLIIDNNLSAADIAKIMNICKADVKKIINNLITFINNNENILYILTH